MCRVQAVGVGRSCMDLFTEYIGQATSKLINQRPEGTEGSAIKKHLIKRPFWYSFFV